MSRRGQRRARRGGAGATMLAIALLLGATATYAQSDAPPGPWVADIRGVTSAIPSETAFYPPLHSSALVPTRGFGLEGGVHVYLFNLGSSRVGLGAALYNIRAVTTPPAPVETPGQTPGQTPGETPAPSPRQSLQIDVRMITPQISFNFGSRDGWSYVSAGLGTTDVITRTAGVLAGRRETSGLRTMNFGGGARWFLKSHIAFGFDLRFHRMAAGTAGPVEGAAPQEPSPGGEITPPTDTPTPGKMFVTVSAGLSFK